MIDGLDAVTNLRNHCVPPPEAIRPRQSTKYCAVASTDPSKKKLCRLDVSCQQSSGKLKERLPKRRAPGFSITTVSPQRIESGASPGIAPGLSTKTLPSTSGRSRCFVYVALL